MADTGPAITAQRKPGSIRAKRKHRTTEGALGEMAPSTGSLSSAHAHPGTAVASQGRWPSAAPGRRQGMRKGH